MDKATGIKGKCVNAAKMAKLQVADWKKTAMKLAKQVLQKTKRDRGRDLESSDESEGDPNRSDVVRDMIMLSSSEDESGKDNICAQCGSTPCEWYVYVDDEFEALIEDCLSGELKDLDVKKKRFRLYCLFLEKKHGVAKKRTIPDCCYNRINTLFDEKEDSE